MPSWAEDPSPNPPERINKKFKTSERGKGKNALDNSPAFEILIIG
jgi:hypothetical protein